MAIKKTIKAYVTIFLIGVIVSIAGLSIYSIYQRNNLQTSTEIYRLPTAAEEVIVKENIKSITQQQKRKDRQKVDIQQPSSVDNTLIQNNNQDDKPEPIHEAPVAIETKADAPDTETPEQRQLKEDMIKAIQASTNPSPPGLEELVRQFRRKGGGLGNGNSTQINSMEDLKRVIAELESTGNPNFRAMIEVLKNTNIEGNTRVEVRTAAPQNR